MRFAETAFAVDGTRQVERRRLKDRRPFAWKGGPPSGPDTLRVSTARHGVRVEKPPHCAWTGIVVEPFAEQLRETTVTPSVVVPVPVTLNEIEAVP